MLTLTGTELIACFLHFTILIFFKLELVVVVLRVEASKIVEKVPELKKNEDAMCSAK